MFWLRHTQQFYTSVPLQVLGIPITTCLLPAVLHGHHTKLEILHVSRSIDPKVDLVEYMQAKLTYGLSVPFDTPLWFSSSASNLLALISFCSWLSELVLAGNFGVITQIPRQVPSTCHDCTLLVYNWHFNMRFRRHFRHASILRLYNPRPILLYPASCIRLEGSPFMAILRREKFYSNPGSNWPVPGSRDRFERRVK